MDIILNKIYVLVSVEILFKVKMNNVTLMILFHLMVVINANFPVKLNVLHV